MTLENNILDIEHVHQSEILKHRLKKTTRFSNYILDIFGRFIGAALLANVSDFFIAFEKYNLAVVFSVLSGIYFFSYYPLLEYFFGKTLGKMLTRSSVVDINGNKITFLQSIIRSLCRFIPFDAFSFLNTNNIGWHDSISKTRVVKDAFFQ